MAIMWLNLSLVYVFSFFSRYFSTSIDSYKEIKPNRLFVFLVMITLITVSGLRNNIGDTYFYMHSYSVTTFNWKDIDYTGDFGFNILQMLLQKISDDPQVLILTTAIMTNFLIVFVLYQYSRFFELSIYVFITLGMFTTSMNGIRQYLAASIAFIATKYLLNGSFTKYTLIILLASTIHQSALILLPIYFFVRREAWTKVTYLLLSSSLLIVIGFNEFSTLLFNALEETQYGHYSSFVEGGANKLRVMVDAVPVLIAYLGRHKLRELWPKSDIIVNMSLICLMFSLISSQNWIFARFNIYFGLYNLILISWLVLLFKERERRFVYYAILVCYMIYFVYEHLIGFGGLDYRSDYINL
ncbi:EpsG family protein [Pseudalkalibacillus caeni]|uniref:EpsG family protein n=1 Tax=Exobacillus caeni TaxID=2574798 RepID=A0A5R9EY60_9BACL|nr:EpsG family protein [Pseudalkalibacillus caeni]TLS35781.1 EpsG family protein [Pseudalkalibacillus caeni]